MNVAQLGISREDLPVPGDTIEEVLEEREISRKELAARLNMTESYLSQVISGKKPISKKLAQGLEYVLGVDKSFWLSLQSNYDAVLMKLNEEDSIDDEEREISTSLRQSGILDYLRRKGHEIGELVDDIVLAFRRIIGVSELRNLRSLSMTSNGAFRTGAARTNPYVLGAWILLAQKATDRTRERTTFDIARISDLLAELKEVMLVRGEPLQRLRDTLGRYGIGFAVLPHFTGAPVQGYISRNASDGYRIVLTIRGGAADVFWFTLFHELGHIVNGDMEGTRGLIDEDAAFESDKERRADAFAGSALIDDEAYEAFKKKQDGVFRDAAISSFAETQHVPMWIVKGRLQREGLVPYSNQTGMLKYQWADRVPSSE